MLAAQGRGPSPGLPAGAARGHVITVRGDLRRAEIRQKAIMSRAATLSRQFRALAAAFDGAIEAAAAARLGRTPPKRALVKLGIDPAAFDDTRF
jgi:hypothetical protein